ncbi:FMN reductase [Aquabacterium sp. A7-Y]|uniref:FMN reductase n=1 Tax=Aquabacterium sp. A7-Y TaxID=1349605 RepID=UPI00223CBC8A|nr:FMN reductase [Aquabacterium sp. A7-Y]MCW7540157.1 FMN reductase [Aquabacterium sp. A7-Y]
MTHRYKLVAIVGSTSATSRTKALAEAIVAALQNHVELDVEYVELAALWRDLGGAVHTDELGPAAASALAAIESSDVIVAASPVYKGSYTGLFKHLIDFLHPEALVGRPVLLAATGGSDRHALSVDHQLRTLFAFFRAYTVPSAVYAAEADFDGYAIKSTPLATRVREAAGQAALLLASTGADRLPALRAAA